MESILLMFVILGLLVWLYLVCVNEKEKYKERKKIKEEKELEEYIERITKELEEEEKEMEFYSKQTDYIVTKTFNDITLGLLNIEIEDYYNKLRSYNIDFDVINVAIDNNINSSSTFKYKGYGSTTINYKYFAIVTLRIKGELK